MVTAWQADRLDGMGGGAYIRGPCRNRMLRRGKSAQITIRSRHLTIRPLFLMNRSVGPVTTSDPGAIPLGLGVAMTNGDCACEQAVSIST
jgi:hypothetical protein